MSMFQLFRPALFALDPEAAHHTTFEGLKTASCFGLTSLMFKRPANDPRTVMGLTTLVAGAAASAGAQGTNAMLQSGHVPGRSETTAGCIGHT